MTHSFARTPLVVTSMLLAFLIGACTPLIGPYSPTSYKYATSLKAETLSLMEKATEPYADHAEDVDALMVDLRKAFEYVRGISQNSLSAQQWNILISKDGDILGRFFVRWQERETLSPAFIEEFQHIVSDAFDEIICLEANKGEVSICKTDKGA